MFAHVAHSRFLRPAIRFALAAGLVGAGISCKDSTGPQTPEIPTGVTVVLLSPTSAKVTWSPGTDSASVRSYNVMRDGTKIGEVSGPLFVDTGLSALVTYHYAVSANGTNGLVSPISADSPGSAITPPDATPPTVVSTSPAAGATGVDRAAKISAVFSEALDPATAIAANFIVKTSGGSDIAGSLMYTPATKTMEFVPAAPLPNSGGISVTITTGIHDVAGNAMAAPAAFAFSTRDDIPPSVVSTTIPPTGDVPLTQTISATMSEAIDSLSLTTATVGLTLASSGAPVPGTTSYDSPSHAITFTPSAGLAGATDYIFAVGPGIKDIAGNASTSAFSKSFRTVDVTQPSVTSVVPANLASSVPVNTAVAVVFNEAMDASTITSSSLTLRLTSSGTFVPGSVAYDASSRTASYLPAAALLPSTGYTIAVSSSVRAANGIVMGQSFLSTFTTAAPVDVTPPAVISVTPSNGALGVAVNTIVKIGFSEAMDQATIVPSAVTLTGAGIGAVAGSVSYDAGSASATFTPASPLQNAVIYTVAVSGSARDLAGNGLIPFSSSFTTVGASPPPDVTPPTVVSSIPSANAANVDVTTAIRVVFSEPMNASTVNASTVFVTGLGGATVAGSVSYDNTTLAAIFVPAAPLQNGTSYTLVATTGLKDLAGNSMSAQFSAAFTTVAAVPPPDTTPPAVISALPSNGSLLVAVTTPIRVTFSESMTASTINTSTFTLAIGGIGISGSVSYDAASRTASFVPSAGLLAEGQTYVATVTTGAKDAAGNSLAANFVFSFQTVDNTPPTIISRSPSPGATGVPSNTTITIGFSEPIDPSTINAGTLTLSTGGSPVSGSVSYDGPSRTATFTPNAALAANQVFTVTVTTGVRDVAGNALASSSTFSFMTAPAPPAFDISGFSEPNDGWWQATTAGDVGIHFHVTFDQSGSSLALWSQCRDGGNDRCITLPRNQAGADAVGPNSAGFVWVLVTALSGTLSGSQINFTITNENGKVFTFTGVVSSLYSMTGTISGPTLPAETITFTRPQP